MMQELQKLYADIPVPPSLKDDILTYCHTAEEKPAPFIVRYAKPLVALAACVAVLLVSLAATGQLFGGGNTHLPVGVPEDSSSESGELQEELIPENVSTTRRTMKTTVRGQTTTRAEGIGGDENACDKHVMFYHGIDGRLIDYVGSDKVQAYLEKNGWLNTAHLTKQEREQVTVVRFLKDFAITKQAFIQAMQWENILDEKPDSGDMYNTQYTYRELADALYSDDQTLIDQVFGRTVGGTTASSVAVPLTTTE